MIASPIYDEIVDFIAANTIPDRLVAFRPSNETKERVAELIQKEKNSRLSADEASELEHYLQSTIRVQTTGQTILRLIPMGTQSIH